MTTQCSVRAVAMLRSDVATLPQIENPRHQLRILGGFRNVIAWTCTAREGHRCPDRRFAGCGAPHVGSEPTAITLDDFIRKAPASLALQVWPLHRQGFWTTPGGHRTWTDHFGEGTHTTRAAARRPQTVTGTPAAALPATTTAPRRTPRSPRRRTATPS